MAGNPRLAAHAWRNLWRNPRRSAITVSSIAFFVMLAVIFTGLQDKQFADMVDLAARLGGGHVTIQHPEFRDSPTLTRTITRADALRRAALLDRDVKRVVSRIAGQIMLSTAGQSYGAAFIAFDPEAEDPETLSMLDAIEQGEIFASADANGIVLGAKLAENLRARLGRKVVYTLTDKHGEIVRDMARVSGIVRTGSPGVDAGLAMLPIDRMRRVLGYAPDEAIQVAVFIDDQREADAVTARVALALSEGATALAWHDTRPELAAFITMKVAGRRFMEAILLLLIVAGIFNTVFVSVMERQREFGIMIALGFSSGQVFRMVMYESLWLGLVGLVTAAAVTAGPYWYLSTRGIDLSAMVAGQAADVAGVGISMVMQLGIFPESLVTILIATLGATLLSGIYPAWKAGHVVPVESIRLV